MTPNGRFQPNQRICTSFSDYHPELWDPSWNVETIVLGLISFWLSPENTAGAIKTSDEEKSGLQERAWSIISAKVRVFRSYSGIGLPSSGSMLKLRLLVSRNNSSLHPKKRQNSRRQKRKSTSKWWASSNLRSALAIWKEARSTKFWFLTSCHLEDRLDTTKR